MQSDGVSDRQQSFRKLKTVCLPLLPKAPVNAQTALTTCEGLSNLQQVISSLPELDSSLCDYVSFPLIQLLRINSLEVFAEHESVLERCMRAMTLIVRPWRKAKPGMKADLLNQIWLVCVLVLGGPLEDTKGKPKRVDWSEETMQATLSVLLALLEPSNEILAPPPMSILGHTVTTLLDLIKESPNFDIRALSLEVLQNVVSRYIASQERDGTSLLVHFFPGLVSALSKLLAPKQTNRVRAREAPADLLQRALWLLAKVIVAVLGNEACRDILDKARRKQASSLEEVVADQAAVVETQPEPGGSGVRSPAWLEGTAAQLHLAFLALCTATRDHHLPLVRTAYIGLLTCLLVNCSQTADKRTRSIVLADLVILTCDVQPEVSARAIASLSAAREVARELSELLVGSLKALPQAVMSAGDADPQIAHAAALIHGSAISLASSDTSSLFRDLVRLGERWTVSLLYALEVSAVPTESGLSAQNLARAWIAPAASTLNGSEDVLPTWPALPLLRISSPRAVSLLRKAFVELGRASLGDKGHQAPLLVDHFLTVTASSLSAKQRTSAWWLLDAVLEACVPSSSLVTAPLRQRKAARSVLQAVLDLAEGDLQGDTGMGLSAAEESSLTLVERVKGSQEVSTRLAAFSGKVASDEEKDAAQRAAQSTRVIMLCLSLRCLATASAVLGLTFRAELVSALYLVLAHLGPASHPLLQEHARVALHLVAEHAGYASVQNLLLDNTDYVINSVSRRLRLPRLDPQAPLVLITMIRLAGKEIVPLVQDVIDDIFDALDDFHQYDALCASLLAVLDALIKTMAVDLPVVEHSVADDPRPKQPEPEADLLAFEVWLEDRQKPEEPEEDFGPPPQGSWAEKVLDEEDTEQTPPAEEPEIPPTRAQAVCLAMLDKALLFISHDSAFLRARVLSLIATGVPVLAERKGDLLAVVHRAWPFMLNRLSAADDPAVVAEAAALVEALGRHVGDFMSRKIIDDAWPRFRTLLSSMQIREEQSAMRGRFTSVHRTQTAILGAMTDVCFGVALRDELVWELAKDMRVFLGSHVDSQMKDRAVALYSELKRWHPEIVWLALSSGQSFLSVEGLDETVIATIQP